MRILKRDAILVKDRQRSEIAAGPLDELRLAIIATGLLHPVVVAQDRDDPSVYHLVAGERRLKAIDMIAAEKGTFNCDGQKIFPGMVPTTDVGDLNEDELYEAELLENLRRVPLTWQDEARATAALHAMRRKQNPSHTQQDTAKEIKAGGAATQTVEKVRQIVSKAVLVAKNLHDPAVAKARTMDEAHNLIINKAKDEIKAKLVQKVSTLQTTHPVVVGDMRKILPTLEAESFDLILTDPPYGLNAGGSGYRERTVHHHNYDDTPEYARNILDVILREGFRVCKKQANLFVFSDIQFWEYFRERCGKLGWSPWHWPVIWQKSEDEGLAPPMSGHARGFAHTFDLIFFATKGAKGLNRLELDILTEKRVSRALRVHAAQKPTALLELLLDISTTVGDRILDPCLGSGTSLVAARRMKRNGLGIELDQATADSAIVRINEEGKPDESNGGS